MSQRGQLRVVHVAEDVSRIAGGIPAVVRQLSERLSRKGIPVQIARATGDQADLTEGIEVFTYPPTGLGRLWSWGNGLRDGVGRLAAISNNDAPLFHVHGAWSAPQYFAARAAYDLGVPFVFSAHGMLEPWLWEQQGWATRTKKRVYWSALAYSAFSKASVIHAITPLEQRYLASLFPNNRIELIPNAIEVGDLMDNPQLERRKTILFLGRIDPKKGLDILLRAFVIAKISNEWSIDVVGPVWSQSYMSKLKMIVDECRLGDRIRFRGPLFGEEKHKLIDTAWVMVTPSHSEAVGLVNLEAAARYLPSITTYQTGLHDWELGGGMLVEPNVNAVGKALESACAWSAQEQRDRGKSSRELVLQRYSWQAVLPLWERLYYSLIS